MNTALIADLLARRDKMVAEARKRLREGADSLKRGEITARQYRTIREQWGGRLKELLRDSEEDLELHYAYY